MKSKAITVAAVAASVLGLAACEFDQSGAVAGSEPEELASRLGGREFLDLTPTSSVAVLAQGVDGPARPFAPVIQGGSLVLRSTETDLLLLEDLDVALGDVAIPPGALGDDAMRLTDIRLHLGTQVVIEDGSWTAGSVAGAGTADLLLDWSLVTSNGTYPLATQKLSDSPFAVEVSLDDSGAITAVVRSNVQGELQRFADRLVLSDFSMAVTASTAPTAPTVVD